MVRPKSQVLGAFGAGRGPWTEDHGRTKHQVPSTKYRVLDQSKKRCKGPHYVQTELASLDVRPHRAKEPQQARLRCVAEIFVGIENVLETLQ